MPGAHDAVLVVLSVIIAVASSFTALDLAGRVRASTGRARIAWLGAAAVAMGGGIWSMHFIAMLAFILPLPVAYEPGLTAVSLILPIAVTGYGFALLSREKTLRLHRLGLAGVVTGSGIAIMHYTGMAAMQLPADLSYDALLVAISVLIAIGAATLALWLGFRGTTLPIQVAAALCMGAAVSAMHYVAMEASVFTPRTALDHALGSAAVSQTSLAIGVAAVTFLILFLALAAALVDRRLVAMSEREAAALRESEENFRTLYRSTPLPLHALNNEGCVLQVSDAWLELLGRERNEVVGHALTEFMTPSSAERRRAEDWPTLLREGELHDIECEFLTRDGRPLTVLLSARVQRDNEGTFLRTLEGMVDITARRRAEEALHHAQKMEAVGQLTGGVAHDFNNLLTAILGSLSLLERHVEDGPRPRRLLETARTAVRRGADLSQRLLAFSRKQPLRTVPVDANELLRETAPLVRRAAGESIGLELDLAPDLPLCRADASQLQAAVLNLAINARDAMLREGHLIISTGLRNLDATDLVANDEASPGAFVEVSVEDTGHGMAPEVLTRAFEPFFTTKEVGKGTGLGLSQVYGFARQLGGHVTIDSAPGRGTRVTIFLPVAGAEDEVAEQAPPPGNEMPQAGVRGTVLVVEDDPEVLGTTAEVLQDGGWRVLTARDGQEALATLETEGEALDIVLSDIVMPGGMSGTDLAAETQRRWPNVRILLTSGYPGSFRQGLPRWVDLLPKPYGHAELLSRLARLTQSSPARTEV